MSSPLVNRIQREISLSTDSVRIACLRADLACYWSRVGEFEAAELLKNELRVSFGKGESLSVSVRLLCLDALLLFFRHGDPLSRDRMLRAKLLSRASGDRSLIALTSAWLAQLDFNYNQIDSMLENIEDALGAADVGDEAAECRVSLVLAGLFDFIDDQSAARIWHEKTRELAVRFGDQATMGALLYNKAIYRVILTRLRVYDDNGFVFNSNELEIDIQNAINYQNVARIKSLSQWLKTLEIGYMILGNQFVVAEAAIRDVLETGEIPRSSSQHLVLESDLLLARAVNSPATCTADEFSKLDVSDLGELTFEEKGIVMQPWAAAARACGMSKHARSWDLKRSAEMIKRQEFVDNVRARLATWRH